MKKIYLLAFAFCACVAANAQHKAQNAGVKSKSLEIARQQRTVATSDRDITCVYSNTFSNVADWSVEFEPGSNADVPWEIGVGIEPSGGFAIDPIESTTLADGIALIDSDLNGAPGDLENTWITLNTPIDCSALDYVSVQFQSFYRKWTGEGVVDEEHCLLEVTTDINNWPDVSTYEDTEAVGRWEIYDYLDVQGPVANPDIKVIDISSIAANQATVYIRFRWVGSWGYAWMLDDLCVFETLQNDLSINEIFNGDIVGDFEYAMIPQCQLTPLILGAVVQNYGYENQTVDIDISVDGASTIVSNEFISSTTDTIWSDPIAVDAALGTKTLSVVAPDDDSNTFNTLSKTFDVTDYVFSHCSADPGFQRGFDDATELSIGAQFLINSDCTVTGIKADFGPATTEDIEVQAFLYEVIGGVQDMEFLTESPAYNVTAADIAADFIDFVFVDEMDLNEGTSYVVEVKKINANADELFLLADLGDPDVATVCFGEFGAAGTDINWFVGWSFSPAIQMIVDCAVDVSELQANAAISNLTLSQNIPNPASQNTVINYNLASAQKVALTVTDMTGRTVKSVNFGQLASGAHTFSLDVSEFSAGVYTYTLSSDTAVTTKEMIVE